MHAAPHPKHLRHIWSCYHHHQIHHTSIQTHVQIETDVKSSNIDQISRRDSCMQLHIPSTWDTCEYYIITFQNPLLIGYRCGHIQAVIPLISDEMWIQLVDSWQWSSLGDVLAISVCLQGILQLLNSRNMGACLSPLAFLGCPMTLMRRAYTTFLVVSTTLPMLLPGPEYLQRFHIFGSPRIMMGYSLLCMPSCVTCTSWLWLESHIGSTCKMYYP